MRWSSGGRFTRAGGNGIVGCMSDAMSDVSPCRASGPEVVLSRPLLALERCACYAGVPSLLPELLDACAGEGPLAGLRGKRVLLKPNLVTARPLACSEPVVVAAACRWLLDQGARVRVADSPGFGTAQAVARKTGLDEALAPLGLRVEALDRPCALRLDTGVSFPVSRVALESDVILSVARVKAHAQMRLTLSVKNLFGCVSGLRKAIIHTRQGQEPDFFADCLAALWAALPPSAGLLDGVTAMHVTGPGNGQPLALGLLGASSSCVALDEAFCALLGCAAEAVPLAAALERRGVPDCLANGCRPRFVRLRPEEVPATNFRVPAHLLHTSFRPWRLLKSCLRRFWLSFKR